MLKLTAKEYRRMTKTEKKKHKFGAAGVYAYGVFFASKKEYSRFLDLRQLEAIGEISDLRFQPTFEFYTGFFRTERWRLDFTYIENGKKVAEDVTGMMTRSKKKKMKLFEQQFPDWELRIT